MKALLINRAACIRHIKTQAPHIKSVSKDFWPVLDRRIAAILDGAVANNLHHTRLTAGELNGVKPGLFGRLVKAVRGT